MKMFCTAALVVLFLASVIGCSDLSDIQTNEQKNVASSEHTRAIVLENLKMALAPSGQAARIYFSGSCDKDEVGDLLFPVVNVQVPAEQGRGLESVQQMFQGDANVVVSEDRSGVIDIIIGNPSTEILNTRLSSLSFSQEAQYNPNGPGNAIASIEDTKEFKIASMTLKVNPIEVFYDSLQMPAVETLPHLPPLIKNITVDQALDSIAKVFRGVVVYGECKKSSDKRLIDIEFYRLHNDISN